MCNLFGKGNISYNLRSQVGFMRTSANTSNFGVNWLKNVAIKVWDIFPYDIKSIENLKQKCLKYK